MLLTRAARPDRLIVAAKLFVESVFGAEFVQKADALLNLEQITNEEVINLLSFLLLIGCNIYCIDSWSNPCSTLFRTWS